MHCVTGWSTGLLTIPWPRQHGKSGHTPRHRASDLSLRDAAPLLYRKWFPATPFMADRYEPSTPSSSTVLETNVDATSPRFEANMRLLADMVSQVRNEEEKI